MKKFFIFMSAVGGVILNAIFMFSGPVFADDVGADVEKLYIKAINPGYTREVDGVKKSNVGEMIVIARKDAADAPISLAGLSIRYTNTSGNTQVVYKFPEYSKMTGEILLLRLASSPGSEAANLTYSTQLALGAGPLALVVGADYSKEEEAEIMADATIYDSVCWTGAEGCEDKFKSGDFTTMVRSSYDGPWRRVEMDDVELLEMLKYDPEGYVVERPVDEGGGSSGGGSDEGGMGSLEPQCLGLEFSEILSYYAESKEEQFIELHNRNAEQILLNGCAVKYKNKKYELVGIVKADGYFVVYPNTMGFSLTKNPTNSNVLEILDVNGAPLDALEYFNGQKKGTAYALVGYDAQGEELWKTTYAATPGEANAYQEFRTCPEGKVINEATGNCVKVTTVEEKICAAGQYLNVLTNRCKKIEEAKVTTCKEGYYLYEETGRCRKIVENTGANYSVTPEEYEEKSSFVALYAMIGVVCVGVLYAIYEFRHEIKKLLFRGASGRPVATGGRRYFSRCRALHTLKSNIFNLSEKIRRVCQQVRRKLHRGAGRHSRKRGGRDSDNE